MNKIEWLPYNKSSVEIIIKQCKEQLQKATGIPYYTIPANEYAKQFLEMQINIQEFTNKICSIIMKKIKCYNGQINE